MKIRPLLVLGVLAALAVPAAAHGDTKGWECSPHQHLVKERCVPDPVVCGPGTHHKTADDSSPCVPDDKICAPPPPAARCSAGKHSVVVDCKSVCVGDDCETKEIRCHVGEHAERTNACGWNCIKDVEPNKCPPPDIVCPDGTKPVQNSDCSAVCRDSAGRVSAALSCSTVQCPDAMHAEGEGCASRCVEGALVAPGSDVAQPPEPSGRPVGQ